MRRIGLAAVAVAMLGAPSGASATGEWDHLLAPESVCPVQSDSAQPPAAQARTMVCMHRFARSASGLSGLHLLKQLRASANRKARDIKRCKDFSHEACGRDAFYWVERVGFFRGASGAGENLALGSGAASTVRATMTSWLYSDEHRSVLLDPSFRNIGIGMVRANFDGHAGTQIWVAHFGFRH